MKKQFFTAAAFGLSLLCTTARADNWTNTGSRWEKNITPSVFQFTSRTTATMQAHIFPAAGGANPNPAITTTTHDLSDGYFAVTGGQIGAGDITDPANVRQAFMITGDTAVNGTGLLRFAQSTAGVTDGYKAGKFLGYVNLNWYVPQRYSGYEISFSSRVYNTGTFGLQLLVYDASGTQLGTTQSLAAGGWNTASFTQTGNRPFRFKMSLPNTTGLVAYYETPKILLVSAAEPAVRTIAVTTSGNGTVTAAYATLRDQDTQQFTITPGAGETVVQALYNGSPVTLTDMGNGSFSYTTPLLTANASFAVHFTPQHFTGTGNWSDAARWSGGVVPGAASKAIIEGKATVSTAVEAAQIQVKPTAQLTISEGSSLSVTGDLTLESNASRTATLVDYGSLTVGGSAVAQQYLTVDRQWWYLASPVVGATSSAVVGSNKIGDYTEATRSYSDAFTGAVTLQAGKGYVVKLDAEGVTDGVFAFSGTGFFDGNLALTPTRTITGTEGDAKRGFNLVGNPYPSYLNWNAAYNEATNLRTTIWYRTRGAEAMEFVTYNASLGVSVPAGINGYIPPMQGFWVKVDNDPVLPATQTTGSITFTNAMRAHADAEGNSTENSLKAPAEGSLQLVRLKLTAGGQSDETLIALHPAAENGYDGFDSDKMTNPASMPVLYTLAEDKPLVINAISENEAIGHIPLVIQLPAAETAGLRWTESTFTAPLQLFLHDKVLNLETELLPGEEVQIPSGFTNSAGRFVLELRAPGITTGATTTSGEPFSVWESATGQLTVRTPAVGATLYLRSLTGQVVHAQPVTASPVVLDHRTESGVYLLTVGNRTRKVVVR